MSFYLSIWQPLILNGLSGCLTQLSFLLSMPPVFIILHALRAGYLYRC